MATIEHAFLPRIAQVVPLQNIKFPGTSSSSSPSQNPTRFGGPAPLSTLLPMDQHVSLPNSQESLISVSSSSVAAALPRLHSSSSNLSASTAPDTQDTELTSPESPNGVYSQLKLAATSHPVIASTSMEQVASVPRPLTPANANPELNRQPASMSLAGSPTSPMSIDAPILAQGAKRTADGAIKAATTSNVSGESSPGLSQPKSPTDATVSVNGKRISELKTRLGYAMYKVQNGWERRSIEELEGLPSQRTTPAPATPVQTASRYGPQVLMSGGSASRRRSLYSDSSDPYTTSPRGNGSPGSIYKRQMLDFAPPSVHAPITQITAQAVTTNPKPMHSVGSLPLAPAADIHPSSRAPALHNRRTNSSHPPPALKTARQDVPPGEDPRTPLTPANPANRLLSHQAEQDAAESLLFMRSPNTSTNVRHTGGSGVASSLPSPLNSKFNKSAERARRVVFPEFSGGDLRRNGGR